MAIQTTPCSDISSIRTFDCSWATLMRIELMTLLTKKWRANFQQIGCCRTVRIVAKRAIFLNWRMASDERVALFHMTDIASVANAIPHRVAGTRRTVGIMAIRASNFFFPDRVTRGAIDLCTLFFMTRKTYFRLSNYVAYFVLCVMYLVTRGTSYIAISMRTNGSMQFNTAY